MLQLVDRIWKLYLKENSEGFASLLFMDQVSKHLEDTIIKQLKNMVL